MSILRASRRVFPLCWLFQLAFACERIFRALEPGPRMLEHFFLFRFLFLISIILFFLLFVQGFHSDRTRCLIRANLKVSPLLNQLKKLTDNNFFISSVFFFSEFVMILILILDFDYFELSYSRRQNSLTLHDMITILFT